MFVANFVRGAGSILKLVEPNGRGVWEHSLLTNAEMSHCLACSR